MDNLDREQSGFIVAQTTLTANPGSPAAADAFKFLKFRVTGGGVHETLTREDQRTARGVTVGDIVQGKKGPHMIPLETYLLPSGTGGTPPDIHLILEQMFEAVSVPSVELTGDYVALSKSFTVALGDIDSGDVGLPIAFANASGEVAVGVVASVSDYMDTTVTLKWALPAGFAPVTGDETLAGVAYKPRSSLDASKHFALFNFQANNAECVSGCAGSQFEISLTRNELVKVKLDVIGRHHLNTCVGYLTENIDGIVLECASAVPVAFGVDATHTPFMSFLDASTLAVKETVKVTNVTSAGVVTMVRAQKGTSAVSHTAGELLAPWAPSDTPLTYGDPLSGLQAKFYGDGYESDVNSLTLRFNEGVAAKEVCGSPELSGYTLADVRKVEIETELYGKQAVSSSVVSTVNGQPFNNVAAQIGTSPGSVFFSHMPAVVFEPIEPQANKNGINHLPMKSKQVCQTNGNDEFVIAFF